MSLSSYRRNLLSKTFYFKIQETWKESVILALFVIISGSLDSGSLVSGRTGMMYNIHKISIYNPAD